MLIHDRMSLRDNLYRDMITVQRKSYEMDYNERLFDPIKLNCTSIVLEGSLTSVPLRILVIAEPFWMN